MSDERGNYPPLTVERACELVREVLAYDMEDEARRALMLLLGGIAHERDRVTREDAARAVLKVIYGEYTEHAGYSMDAFMRGQSL